jgi:hypothetical protein
MPILAPKLLPLITAVSCDYCSFGAARWPPCIRPKSTRLRSALGRLLALLGGYSHIRLLPDRRPAPGGVAQLSEN